MATLNNQATKKWENFLVAIFNHHNWAIFIFFNCWVIFLSQRECDPLSPLIENRCMNLFNMRLNLWARDLLSYSKISFWWRKWRKFSKQENLWRKICSFCWETSQVDDRLLRWKDISKKISKNVSKVDKITKEVKKIKENMANLEIFCG